MQIKHLALLFLFALPLSAQAPSDPQRDFLAECSQDRLSVKMLTAQARCLLDVQKKGDELSRAVQAMQKAATNQGVDAVKKPDGSAWMSDATKAADEFIRAEKACSQK